MSRMILKYLNTIEMNIQCILLYILKKLIISIFLVCDDSFASNSLTTIYKLSHIWNEFYGKMINYKRSIHVGK